MAIANQSNLYRYLAIAAFIGSGVLSTYIFFLATSLPALEGISDDMLLLAVSFAWILIFPLWIILFLLAMTLLDTIERKPG